MTKAFQVDFIGIGTTRGGTTWLANCLRAHPQICLSSRKEIGYFNFHDHYHGTANENHAKPLSWYMEHFRHGTEGQVKGEFSPVYMLDAKAPHAIKERFPEVKLIACLRNPIDRAYSGYWIRKSFLKTEKRSFEEAAAAGAAFVDFGFYGKQLKTYFKIFPEPQILILLFEDMIREPREALRRVFRFLGVDPEVEIPAGLVSKKENAARKIRFKPITEGIGYLQRVSAKLKLGFVWAALRKVGMGKLAEKTFRPPLSYPKMSPHMRERLFEIYKADIQDLERLSGRDLSHWR